jgi:hypothetical protein
MNAGPGFVKFKEEMIEDWRGRDYPKEMEIIIEEEEPELAMAEAEGPIVAQEDVAEIDFDDADARLRAEETAQETEQKRVEYDEDGNPIDPTADAKAGLTDEAKPADGAGLTDEAKPAHGAGLTDEAKPAHGAGLTDEAKPAHGAGLTDEAKPAHDAGLTVEAKPAEEEVLPIGVGALHDWESWGKFENKKVAWVGDYEVDEEKIAFSIDSMLCGLDRKLTGSGCDARGSY